MAPTICSEKECRMRGGIRELRRSSNSSSSSSVISYAGRITHRRKKTARNLSSKLASKRSEHKRIYESDSTDENTASTTDNNSQSPSSASPSSDDDNLETMSSQYILPVLNENRIPRPCLDRLSPFEYEICRYISRKDSNDEITTSSTFLDEDCAPSKIFCQQKKKNSKGLFEIALKTIKLIKRNQLLQQRLAQLQLETSEFIQSVMANPENRALREKINNSDS